MLFKPDCPVKKCAAALPRIKELFMTDDKMEFDEFTQEDGDDPNIVELIDDKGVHRKFFYLGQTLYKGKTYVCFTPAEGIEGLDDNDAVILEAGKDEETGKMVCLPVEDEAVLEDIFQQFCREMEEEEDAEEAELLDCGCEDALCSEDDSCCEDDSECEEDFCL